MEKNLIDLPPKNEYLLYEEIKETDKLIKYLLSFIMLLGATGFLLVGISSYLKYNIVPMLKSEEIIFFPQGITMCFYGTLGTIISILQIKTLSSNIGEGFNEFNKETGKLRVFRKGFKGKESDIDLSYSLNDILRLVLMILQSNKQRKMQITFMINLYEKIYKKMKQKI